LMLVWVLVLGAWNFSPESIPLRAGEAIVVA